MAWRQKNFIFENTEEIPHCPNCGKMVRPDVTLYGELLPQNDYEQAVAWIRYADLVFHDSIGKIMNQIRV